MSDRIRLGMVGGGEGAFIGAVHRIAARMNDHYELVAGAFSSDAQRSQRSAQALRKQAAWRTDPEQSGAGGSTGDIGTHAHHLAGFVTGLEVEELAADLHSFVDGRVLDDNAHVMMRYRGGAKGMLWCSPVAAGNENALRSRIYGEDGGLEWSQESPNELWYTPLGEPKRLLTRAGAGASDEAARLSRTPSGHPEGYLEGFANIYSEAAAKILAARDDSPLDEAVHTPGITDGLAGVGFVDACVRSSRRNGAWVKM